MNKENEEYSRDLFKSLEKYDSEFTEIIYNFSQVEVEKVCKLSDKDKFLCILSVLIGCQSLSMFANVLDVTLKKNVDVIAIKEMLYQATAYLGIGRTYDYLIKANEIMSKNDIALPLGSQATTNETNRFEKGLDKQVALFGKQMLDNQTTAPKIRKNINRWLASNCFGDYYTRTGLNNKEREMITFCFILAQGGCENQLRGHTAGNFNVGNGKEKLYQIIEQCVPYIGYPRSLNAMNIVDEISLQYENK